MIARMTGEVPRLGPVRNAALTALHFAIGTYGLRDTGIERLQAHIRRMVLRHSIHYHRDDGDGHCAGG